MRVLRLPLAERLAALRNPAITDKMLEDVGPDGGAAMFGELIVRGGDEAPAALAGRTLGEIAAERGQTPARALIDLTLEHGLGDVAFLAASRGHRRRPEPDRAAMLASPYMHIGGASDGGAHLRPRSPPTATPVICSAN